MEGGLSTTLAEVLVVSRFVVGEAAGAPGGAVDDMVGDRTNCGVRARRTNNRHRKFAKA